jgi:phosphoglucosamine mutase
MVCEKGNLVDGDQLMGTIAERWRRDGRLTGGGVVATVMSNLGLERFIDGHGLRLVRTQVGDRYVLERMRADGFNLGGEQSGPHHHDRPCHHRRWTDGRAAGAVGADQEPQARE